MIYRTIEKDRWDMISYRFYGHPDYYREIIKANPYLPEAIKKASVLPAGIILEIPELQKEILYPEELPPWKR